MKKDENVLDMQFAGLRDNMRRALSELPTSKDIVEVLRDLKSARTSEIYEGLQNKYPEKFKHLSFFRNRVSTLICNTCKMGLIERVAFGVYKYKEISSIKSTRSRVVPKKHKEILTLRKHIKYIVTQHGIITTSDLVKQVLACEELKSYFLGFSSEHCKRKHIINAAFSLSLKGAVKRPKRGLYTSKLYKKTQDAGVSPVNETPTRITIETQKDLEVPLIDYFERVGISRLSRCCTECMHLLENSRSYFTGSKKRNVICNVVRNLSIDKRISKLRTGVYSSNSYRVSKRKELIHNDPENMFNQPIPNPNPDESNRIQNKKGLIGRLVQGFFGGI